MDTIDIADLHEAMIAGRQAWQTIKVGRRKLWEDWLVIGSAFQVARTEAMSVAGSNQPGGRRYNTEMGRLLEKYELHDIGKNTRACLLRVMDKRADVEEWRSKQEDPDDFNHPASVWQKFSRSSKARDAKDKKRLDNSPAALIKKLKAEVEELTERNQELEEERLSNANKVTVEDEALDRARKRVEALGPPWGLQEPRHDRGHKSYHIWNDRDQSIRCRNLDAVHAKLDEIEKTIAPVTPNELERLRTENAQLKTTAESFAGMMREYFKIVMEVGIPREMSTAIVRCLHSDQPTPTPEQRADAFRLFQGWKRDLEKVSRASSGTK
jgi:hypothetical protein